MEKGVVVKEFTRINTPTLFLSLPLSSTLFNSLPHTSTHFHFRSLPLSSTYFRSLPLISAFFQDNATRPGGVFAEASEALSLSLPGSSRSVFPDITATVRYIS